MYGKDGGESLRVEALGCAIENMTRTVHLVVAAGLAEIKKVKCKEEAIVYQDKDGRQEVTPTPHFKIDLKRSSNFFEKN